VLILCAHAGNRLCRESAACFIAKHNLDTYATELVREAEITGQVGNATSTRAEILSERWHLAEIDWSRTGQIQLNEEVTVTATLKMDIGFGGWLHPGGVDSAGDRQIGGVLEMSRITPYPLRIVKCAKDTNP
jgi:hypothetical protein